MSESECLLRASAGLWKELKKSQSLRVLENVEARTWGGGASPTCRLSSVHIRLSSRLVGWRNGRVGLRSHPFIRLLNAHEVYFIIVL